jgi:hypothetical protein
MGYYWMSFCDPKNLVGSKFLGALIIKASDDLEAVRRSWSLGLNPGGEVVFYEIPKQYESRIPDDWVESRLINRAECDEFEKKWAS